MFDHLYNFHDVILIMTAAFSMLLAIPILFQSMPLQRNRIQQDVVLALFVSVQGLLALYYLFLYSMYYRPLTFALLQPFQSLPVAVLFGVQGFLLFWFSRLMTGQTVTFRRSEFIVLAVVVVIPVINRIGVTHNVDLGPKHDGIFLTFPALIASVYYGICSITTVGRHERQIKERYSNLEHVNLVWLGYIALGFVGVWCIRLTHYFVGMWGFHDLENTMAMASNFPPLVLVAAMVIMSLSRSRVVVTRPAAKDAPTVSIDDPAEISVDPEVIARLENLMVEIRVYEDPGLDRDGLADSLGVSSRWLSSCINNHYGHNFYEFVNHYRIEAAKVALQDPDRAHLSIQQIFEQAGFNSKSTFNTLFKKATGMTPSEFRRRNAAAIGIIVRQPGVSSE